MFRRPPGSNLTDNLLPYTTLVRAPGGPSRVTKEPVSIVRSTPLTATKSPNALRTPASSTACSITFSVSEVAWEVDRPLATHHAASDRPRLVSHQAPIRRDRKSTRLNSSH